ncbi:MAG: farnesyl-diphosphate farnesyltransferase [Acidobacteria bacterium]|nr:farnesyl-diphosphate farnesyltransferase [Acidobacteriota bacterium]
MEPELLASYRSAETVARSRSNFYYSFVVLPEAKRRAFCAVYAFMRYCDDISDGDSGLESKRRMLRDWRAQLDAAYAGVHGENPILPAFCDTVRTFSIPAEYFHWIIDGAEMDLDTVCYETFEDLYTYCFRVASAVGLVCLQLFGFAEERAKKHAEQCGIAFQLTNILRDVKEDAESGRVYLPAEDLRKFDYTTEELRRGVLDERFRKLMRFETERARDYYRAARNLLPLVESGSRPALWAMITIYESLLNRIVRRRFDVFSRRIRLTGPEKLIIAARALAMRCAPGGRFRMQHA